MKKILKWLDNFWYHYKWYLIVGIFFITAITIMTAQFITKDNYDSIILYTGPDLPSANETRDMENAFEKLLQEKYNDKKVSIDAIFLLSDAQLEDDKYTKDEQGNKVYIDTKELVKNKEHFTTRVFAGDTRICLLDPYWYDLTAKNKAFVPLNEIFEKIPDNIYDEGALYFKQTEFAKANSCFDCLPDDTLICFRRMSTASTFINKNKEKEKYEFDKEFFADIINFKLK